MANLVDLKKKVGVVLEKRKLPNITCAVAATFDISGSMSSLYSRGAVQEIAEKLFAIALRFDDNGNLDAWAFHNDAYELEGITEQNYQTYVNEQVLNNSNVRLWGGTSYLPVLEQVSAFYYGNKAVKMVAEAAKGMFGKIGGMFGAKKEVPVATTTTPAADKSTDTPVFLMFLTDGENDDGPATMKFLRELQDKNVYVEFVGIGTESFRFCRNAADELPNVGFVQIKDITKIADDDLYMELLNPEFCAWASKNAKAAVQALKL